MVLKKQLRNVELSKAMTCQEQSKLTKTVNTLALPVSRSAVRLPADWYWNLFNINEGCISATDYEYKKIGISSNNVIQELNKEKLVCT